MVDAIRNIEELLIPQHEIAEFLLGAVKEQNYVPADMENDYRKALFRFYCRQMGLSIEAGEEEPEGLRIRILGPGCASCDRLEKEVLAVLSEEGIRADVMHIRDLKEIAGFGVTGAPALVIDDRVCCIGRIPTRAQIREWLHRERSESP